jgi:hypothetical protein
MSSYEPIRKLKQINTILEYDCGIETHNKVWCGRGGDLRVVGFTTTYTISAYHYLCCEFESRSRWGVLDTRLCDKVFQWLATSRWFSLGTPISSTSKTDRHHIAEILLKVAINTIPLTLAHNKVHMYPY